MKIKPVRCYKCGEPMTAATLDDVWQMRIDGQLHDVPVKCVPCHACTPCDTYVIDGCSDEVVQYWYVEYCTAHGLYTPWRRFVRWCRHRIEAARDRWSRRYRPGA